MFFVVMLLIVSVGNQVYFKRMTSSMPNYGWFLSQLSTTMYVPFFAFLSGRGIFRTKKAMIKKFSMMGVFDGMQGTFMILGGVHTSGTMQVLIQQSVIPLSLFFSVLLLRKRFHIVQQFGASIIVIGIILAKLGGGSDVGSSDLPLFNLIFFMSTIPNAFSSVFKEVAFKDFSGDLDVNVLQFWVACFQVLTNCVVGIPIYTLPMLGPQRVRPAEMVNLVSGGSACLFLQQDQIITNCGGLGQRPCDHCASAWMSVGTYLFFNASYNIFTMLVIKHGSAALAFLVATLRMPLASLAFGSTWVMGSEAVPPTRGDFFSLFVIITGLVVYRYGGRLLKSEMQKMASTTTPVAVPGESPVMPPLSPDKNKEDGEDDEKASPISRMLNAALRRTSPKWNLTPLVTTGMIAVEPTFILVRAPQVQPRSNERVRHDLIRRLGTSPLQSPEMRALAKAKAAPSYLIPDDDDGNDRRKPLLQGHARDQQESDFAMVGLSPNPHNGGSDGSPSV